MPRSKKMKLRNLTEKLSRNSVAVTSTGETESDPESNSISLVAFPDADNEMKQFLKVFEANPNIRRVFLRTDFLMEMREDNASRVIRSVGTLPNLEELHVQSSSRFHIDFIPAEGLCECLQNSHGLVSLTLEDIQLTASHHETLQALSKGLKRHPTLQDVTMTNFFANDWTNTEAHFLDPLVYALGSIPTLKYLEFSGCGSHALQGQDVQLISPKALAGLLHTNDSQEIQESTSIQGGKNSLENLQLSFLELEDEHFDAIATQIESSGSSLSLDTLVLDYHILEEVGFQRLMEAMKENITISQLSLRSLRDIGQDGYHQAMAMLQQNYFIESLSVTASPTYQAQIDLYLRMNSAGRKLLRNPSASMGQWINVLAQNSNDVDLVRHFLQEIPSLCQHAATAAYNKQVLRTDDGNNAAVINSALLPSDSPSERLSYIDQARAA